MLHLVTGENTYQAEQEVRSIARASKGEVRWVSGDTLTLDGLADILMGVSLFASSEVTVLTHVGDTPAIWEKLGEWAERVDPGKTIIVWEPKPDKRTRAYKSLAAHAQVHTCPSWTDRQDGLAREWLAKRARESGVKLSPSQVANMVSRATRSTDAPGISVIDQRQLHNALTALSVVDDITDDAITATMPALPAENIFHLLTYAVDRDVAAVQRMLAELRATDDAHRTFALIAGQWFQLMSLALVPAGSAESLGIKPYAARSLSGLVRQVNRAQLRDLTQLCADIDAGMKLSQFEPWDGVERFLLGIALR